MIAQQRPNGPDHPSSQQKRHGAPRTPPQRLPKVDILPVREQEEMQHRRADHQYERYCLSTKIQLFAYVCSRGNGLTAESRRMKKDG